MIFLSIVVKWRESYSISVILSKNLARIVLPQDILFRSS